MAALAACEPATLARERMIDRYLPMADRIARRYVYTKEPLDDLKQVARVGLVKAVDRWDPGRATAFTTFAVPTIIGELQRHFRDCTWAIRPPRELQERYLKVRRFRAALATELGREPRARDIADAIGCGIEDVVEALAVGQAYAPHSLDAPAHDDDGITTTGLDLLADDGRALMQRLDGALLTQLAESLDARSREVLRLRFQEVDARPLCGLAHLADGVAQQPRDVHLRAADALPDLVLHQVFLDDRRVRAPRPRAGRRGLGRRGPAGARSRRAAATEDARRRR